MHDPEASLGGTRVWFTGRKRWEAFVLTTLARYEHRLVILPCREICKIKSGFLKYIFIYLFGCAKVLAVACGFSFLIRDQTLAPCTGSAKSAIGPPENPKTLVLLITLEAAFSCVLVGPSRPFVLI